MIIITIPAWLVYIAVPYLFICMYPAARTGFLQLLEILKS